MKSKSVFKTKNFARWAKNVLTDEQLCAAAKEIMRGLYEADLGAGLCKKRIAVTGQGNGAPPERWSLKRASTESSSLSVDKKAIQGQISQTLKSMLRKLSARLYKGPINMRSILLLVKAF